MGGLRNGGLRTRAQPQERQGLGAAAREWRDTLQAGGCLAKNPNEVFWTGLAGPGIPNFPFGVFNLTFWAVSKRDSGWQSDLVG